MSSAKERILERIHRNKPALRILPETAGLHSPILDTEAVFLETLKFIGAEAAELFAIDDPQEWMEARFGRNIPIVCLDPDLGAGNLTIGPETPLDILNTIEVAVIPGKLGVAENGAVWLDDSLLPHRILPFIAQHLVLTLERKDLVPDMHEAYRRISVAETGFGIFIAGPSKTADIEQALVKGAQGPRTATVVLK